MAHPSARTTPRTLAAAASLAALAALLLGACSGSSDGGSGVKVDDSAATVDATTTTAAPTTSTATTTTAAAPTGLPGQDEVAQRLYDAWAANDKVTAATVADPAAIEAMWQAAPGSYSLYNHCSSGEFDTSGCLFRGNPGTIQIDLDKRGDNWVVAGAFFSPPGSN